MEETKNKCIEKVILQSETWQHKFDRTFVFLSMYNFIIIIEITECVCMLSGFSFLALKTFLRKF